MLENGLKRKTNINHIIIENALKMNQGVFLFVQILITLSSMLYIQFHINDPKKYSDFESLFDFMVKCRDYNFKFEEPEEEEIDWNSLSEEEMDRILDEEEEREMNPNYLETKLIKEIIPQYAMDFLQTFADYDQQVAGNFGFDLDGILNYLINDFEVDLDQLKLTDNSNGILEFSTGNYPFGGLERFFIALKAYDFIPYECFNGFEVHSLTWSSNFKYEVQEFPEKTKEYLSRFQS